ncbi:MAG: T9SS type A sorting domain-containing protein [Bacteroidia bacterium]|jgi:hypothetical protein|nr:T9SS type A sorting domain-containing protein [Bacteroidia bacterium]
MKRIIFSVLALFIYFQAFTQITFQKGHLIHSSDIGVSILNDTNNGMVILSNDNQFVQFISLGFIDQYGNSISTIDYSTTENMFGREVIRLSDGGFLITGSVTINLNQQMLLIKTDASGNVIWTRSYGTPNTDRGSSVKQGLDGNYYIYGTSSGLSSFSSAFLLKTDTSGNIIWLKDLSGIGINYSEKMIISGNSDIIVCGWNANDLCIARFDTGGNAQWAKTYSAGFGDLGSSIQETSSGSIIVAGTTYVQIGPNAIINHALFIKVDNAGNLLWADIFGGCCNDNANYAIETSDGGYLVTGGSNSFVGNSLVTTNLFLIKTDTSGTPLWSKYYGGNINSLDWGNYIAEIPDSGFAITGRSVGACYILKTDKNGSVLCNGYPFQLTNWQYNLNTTTQPLVVNNGTFTSSVYSITQTTVIPTVVDPCTVDIPETAENNSFQLFPNPTTDYLNIKGALVNDRVFVYNTLGQLVKNETIKQENGQIVLSDLPKGVYYITLMRDNVIIHSQSLCID